MKCFFIRVNGQSAHNDPKNKDCYIGDEEASFLRKGYSNYLSYCFENNIVRFGWPNVGDLSKNTPMGVKRNCYSLGSLPSYIREYLFNFRDIPMGSILLVPDRDNSGDIYICEVEKPYWYDTSGPFECSHRLGVKWDRNPQGNPILYRAEKLGISKGGWWLRAFKEISGLEITKRIASVRER